MVSFCLVEASVETPISSTELQIKPLQAEPVMFLHTTLQETPIKAFCRHLSPFRRQVEVFHSGQGDCSGPVLPFPSLLLTPQLAGKI